MANIMDEAAIIRAARIEERNLGEDCAIRSDTRGAFISISKVHRHVMAGNGRFSIIQRGNRSTALTWLDNGIE